MYDLQELKTQTDCRTVAESLLGQPCKRTQGRSLFHCPFHAEKTPSFWVYADGWTCYGGCKRSGSVLDLVMELQGLDLTSAAEYLGASQFVSETPKAVKPPKPEPQAPNQAWQKSAYHTLQLAIRNLNSLAGLPAMRYLTEVRKLEPWVLWANQVGYLPYPQGETRHVSWHEYYKGVLAPCGITLPAFDPERQLWGVRVRLPKPPQPLPDNRKPDKYSGFKGSKLIGSMFMGEAFYPERPIFLDEGEFNALAVLGCYYDLNRQLIPMALSSVNNSLSKAWLDRLLFAPVVFIRTDRGSGDQLAEELCQRSKRFVRVQVPEPYKDPNELLIAEGKPALLAWLRGVVC